MRLRVACALACVAVAAACSARPPPEMQRADEVPVPGLRHIQRTLRLLSTGPQQPQVPLRILFYGQSITESAWSRAVTRQLRARFPRAALTIENRALGGFSSELLVRAAETDLYPFYPDLVIFHVYGAHHRYEQIVRRLRERTTAEILLQNDHVLQPQELHEETRPEALSPDPALWTAFMNHRFLPSLVERYRVALCDQRSAWKRHLIRTGEPPSALLRDSAHLNAAGDALMAHFVTSCLRYAPELGPSPAEAWVETLRVGHALFRQADVIELAFTGNRIDLVVAPGPPVVDIAMDGKPPSAWPELYVFTRAHSSLSKRWPPVFDLHAEAPLLQERWRLTMRRLSAEPLVYTFTLTGSQTGPDGQGRTDQRFVSDSRRVVIEPDDWIIRYAFELGSGRAPPEQFAIRFEVLPQFLDEVPAWQASAGAERSFTLAQGLPNGAHRLALRDPGGRVVALRVYRPPSVGGDAASGE